MPLECPAPLSLSWPSHSDAPCGKGVRSGCSDCWATRTGAVTEGLQGPRLSHTRCDKMTRCLGAVTADVGSVREMETAYTLSQT